jgi:hypothetical protein
MPLLDHFHPPLSEERSFESFHAAWAGSLADDLNRRLPEGYFAEETTHAGPGIEIDVPTWERTAGGGGVAVAAQPQVWAPPAADSTIPAVFCDDFEVRVIGTLSGRRLVAAIELVSPRNKDRPEARKSFAIKCASYLVQGVSLIVVDIVTGRNANMHREIMALVPSGQPLLPAEVGLYAVAHRPVRRDGQELIDLWAVRLAVGSRLPVLPLALSAEVCLAIDLEATYMDARQRRRLIAV